MSEDAYDFEGAAKWERKCWGLVQHVFSSPDVAVSILKVDRGFRCSRHLHRSRANQFVVISGKLFVAVWESSEAIQQYPDSPATAHVLVPRPGSPSQLTVKAGRPHMFRVLESGLVVEIYTPDGGPVDISDITRFDEGGHDEPV